MLLYSICIWPNMTLTNSVPLRNASMIPPTNAAQFKLPSRQKEIATVNHIRKLNQTYTAATYVQVCTWPDNGLSRSY